MNYLSKYLKYKDKYLKLKNLIGGQSLSQYLISKGITDFNLKPDVLYSPEFEFIFILKENFILEKWNDLICLKLNEKGLRNFEDEDIFNYQYKFIHKYTDILNSNNLWFKLNELGNTTLIKHLDKYFDSSTAKTSSSSDVLVEPVPTLSSKEIKIPEIIIPNKSEINVDQFSKLNLTSSVSAGVHETAREYNIKMTHVLLKIYPNKPNYYDFYGLYYHDASNPDDEQIKMIKKIIIDEIKSVIELKENGEFPEIEIKKEYDKIDKVNSNIFWNESKYFVVGHIYFKCTQEIKLIYIEKLIGWIMQKGSGLKMLCILLYVFFYIKNSDFIISLDPGSTKVVEKFYQKIGFKCPGKCTLNDMGTLITKHCSNCLDNVKMIIQYGDDYLGTESLEKVQNLLSNGILI